MSNYFLKITEYFNHRLNRADKEINDLKREDERDEEDESSLFEAIVRLSNKVERIEGLIHQLARKFGVIDD